jgi:DNA-3-methyladenine glycosylase II
VGTVLRARSPFPWAEMLAYLSHRLTPGIEAVEEDRYRRQHAGGAVSVSFDSSAPRLVIETTGSVDHKHVRDRVAALFDTEFDYAPVAEALGRSRLLAARMKRVPGMRPLGTWSPFELCVRTILGQQVTVAAAGTLMRRWVERCGAITPECVLSANLDNIGMPTKRVATIRSLAQAVLDGAVRFDAPWGELNEALAQLPGFGPWTREYLAIRLGREPDAFPASDLGLIRAAGVSKPAELLELAERWRPYRAYAATYLWAVAAHH